MPTYFMFRSLARIVSSIFAGHLLLRREASAQYGRQLVSINVRAKQCIQLASRVHQVESGRVTDEVGTGLLMFGRGVETRYVFATAAICLLFPVNPMMREPKLAR